MAETIPTLNQSGPNYASNVSYSLAFLGEHTHDGINTGPLINLSSQNVIGDLDIDGYNVSSVRGVILNVQGAPLTGSIDVNELYDVNGDLYFNDSNGDVIQITKDGYVNSSSTTTSSLVLKSITNANYTIASADPYTAFDVSTTSSAVTLTLPVAASVVPGRFYYVYDIGNNAGTLNITIAVAGGSGNTIDALGTTGNATIVLNSNGQSCFLWTDGSGIWFLSMFAQKVYNDIVSLYDQGSSVTFANSSLLAIESSSTLLVDSGASEAVLGTVSVGTGGALNLLSGSGTVFSPGSSLSGTVSSGHLVVGGEIEIASGGTLLTDVGSTTTINSNPTINGNATLNGQIIANGLITSTAGSNIAFSSVGITLPATGSITLTSTQYNHFILLASGPTLTGGVTIVFPNQQGIWIVDTSNINFSGQTITMSESGTGHSTAISAAQLIMVITYSGGAGVTAGKMTT
jgi:hypothetical protein